MPTLTTKEREILEYIKINGYTNADKIAEAVGYKHGETVIPVLKGLVRLGYLEQKPMTYRIIKQYD